MFVLPFAIFGFLHFGPLEFSVPYVPSFLPFPALWVYFSGLCLMAFTLSALVKKYDGLASLLLGFMLFLFVLMIHVPKAASGDFLGVIAVFRDTAMAGAAWLYFSSLASDYRFTGFRTE